MFSLVATSKLLTGAMCSAHRVCSEFEAPSISVTWDINPKYITMRSSVKAIYSALPVGYSQ